MSILGMVLLAASAVTAAILPDKTAKTTEGANDGTLLTAGTDDPGKTCVTDSIDDNIYSCNRSVGATVTTAAQGVESYTGENNDQTQSNTSDSALGRHTSV